MKNKSFDERETRRLWFLLVFNLVFLHRKLHQLHIAIVFPVESWPSSAAFYSANLQSWINGDKQILGFQKFVKIIVQGSIKQKKRKLVNACMQTFSFYFLILFKNKVLVQLYSLCTLYIQYIQMNLFLFFRISFLVFFFVFFVLIET